MAILRTRTPAMQVQTLPLEGTRILRATWRFFSPTNLAKSLSTTFHNAEAGPGKQKTEASTRLSNKRIGFQSRQVCLESNLLHGIQVRQVGKKNMEIHMLGKFVKKPWIKKETHGNCYYYVTHFLTEPWLWKGWLSGWVISDRLNQFPAAHPARIFWTDPSKSLGHRAKLAVPTLGNSTWNSLEQSLSCDKK